MQNVTTDPAAVEAHALERVLVESLIDGEFLYFAADKVLGDIARDLEILELAIAGGMYEPTSNRLCGILRSLQVRALAGVRLAEEGRAREAKREARRVEPADDECDDAAEE